MTWSTMDEEARRALCRRGLEAIFDADLKAAIGRIIDDVRVNGDEAVCRALREFDHVSLEPDQLRATPEEIADAEVADEVDLAIDDAIAHLRAFNTEVMKRAADWSFESEPGLSVGEKITPISSAGLFVPSGKASYPSVAYQLAVPAIVAGVPELALVVPPMPGGGVRIDPAVLVVCRKLGIDKVFRVNGPAGVAALGFGTESIPQVRKIVGPGSPPVACAQVEMQRHGVVTMMILGPTESMVIADDSADPRYLAADLLNEAEHGTDSSVVLVTTSEKLRDEVDRDLLLQMAGLPAARSEAARAALGVNGGCVIVARSRRGRRGRQSLGTGTSPGGRRRCRRSRDGRPLAQRRRDPRRPTHVVRGRQLRHRLPGQSADRRIRPRLEWHHRGCVSQANRRGSRRRRQLGGA